MADNSTSAPALTWGEAFRGLLPSLNTCLIAIVSALITFGGTVATQKALSARPPVEKIVIPPADPVPPRPVVEDKSGAILNELEAIRRELQERLPAKPAPRIRPLK